MVNAKAYYFVTASFFLCGTIVIVYDHFTTPISSSGRIIYALTRLEHQKA